MWRHRLLHLGLLRMILQARLRNNDQPSPLSLLRKPKKCPCRSRLCKQKQPESKEKSSEESDTGASAMAPGYQAAYLNNQQPPYPLLSRRLREEGMVRLRVFVTAQGRAEASSGSDKQRVCATRYGCRRKRYWTWRFIPARQQQCRKILPGLGLRCPSGFKLEK